MEIIQLNQNNYKQYLPMDIAAFKLAFAGACGDEGGVEIITTDGVLYYFNLLSGNLAEPDVYEILPFLHESNFKIAGYANSILNYWGYFDLGMGNHLFVRSYLHEPLNNAWEEYEQRNDSQDPMLYSVWKDLLLPILNCSQK